MRKTSHIYFSFLLRLYGRRDDRCWTWRVSLEDPLSGQTYHFASLEALFAFLTEEMARRAVQQGGSSAQPK